MNKNLHFSIGDKSDSIRVDDEDGQITGDRLFPILTELNALPALVETLTHELENVWKPAAAMASQYAKGFEADRDALRLILGNCPLLFVTTCNMAEKAWIANARALLSSTAGDELRGVLKQAHKVLVATAVKYHWDCHKTVGSRDDTFEKCTFPVCCEAQASLAALSQFLPIGEGETK